MLESTSKFRARTALLVEGQPGTAELMTQLLNQESFSCRYASTLAEGKRLVSSGTPWNLAFVSLDLPDGEGLELIQQYSKLNPAASIYPLISPADVMGAFRMLKAGVRDCIIKCADPERLSRQARLAIASHERLLPSGEGTSASDFLELVLREIAWKSAAMQRALAASSQAATSQQVIVIEGEPNTGKDAFAKRILREVGANSGQVTTLDVSKVSNEEAELMLFGAPLRKRSKSSGGGFFTEDDAAWKILRGVECLSPMVRQAVAARVLQIAMNAPSSQACRFIISVSLNGPKVADARGFFADLPGHRVSTPALRDCIVDLEPIMERMLERICIARRMGFVEMTPTALRMLKAHSWPGNLAELRGVLEHAATHSPDGIIATDDLPPFEQQLHAFKPRIAMGISTIQNVQKAALVSALESCNGNRRLAAKKMGVSLRTIYNMINRYELSDEFDESQGL
jgi:DNA-binding NtrC family response regulator